MNKILTILKHEYITRVRKKSFILMTLLGPVLIAAFYGGIFYLTANEFSKSKELSVVLINAPTGLEKNINKNNTFTYSFSNDLEKGKERLKNEELDVLVRLENFNNDSVQMTSRSSLSITDKQTLLSNLETAIFNLRLQEKGIDKNSIDSLKPNLTMIDQLENGTSSAIEIKSGLGYISALLIYMFIFVYGVMIMKAVTEEKTNRIVEIIVSSVKPFELMMGKILGVTLVGLTQFVSWILLTGVLIFSVALIGGVFSNTNLNDMNASALASSPALEILQQLKSIDFFKIIVCFIMYFFGGFLFYSGIFAAIGSAVDQESETQQFVLPVSLPLILGLIIAQISVIKDPHSVLSVWASMVPFTSPIVMMVRVPFDVSWAQIGLSMFILTISFLTVVWLSARIYTIGILSYGQKASFKQLFKWMIRKG